MKLRGFPLLRRPRSENTSNSLGISTILKGPEASFLLKMLVIPGKSIKYTIEIHRFRRGKSSQECPVTARITENHIFYILIVFSQTSPEIVKLGDSLVNSIRIRYFGGPVLDLGGLGSGSTNNQLIWEAAAPNQWIFNGSGRPPKGGPCHASNSQARVTLQTPRPVSRFSLPGPRHASNSQARVTLLTPRPVSRF